jgi:hypothetical protein
MLLAHFALGLAFCPTDLGPRTSDMCQSQLVYWEAHLLVRVLTNFLPWLALNLSPPNLGLPNSWNYKC